MGGPKTLRRFSTHHHPSAPIFLHAEILHHIPVVRPVRLYLTGLGICSGSQSFIFSHLYATHPNATAELLYRRYENTITFPYPHQHFYSEVFHHIHMVGPVRPLLHRGSESVPGHTDPFHPIVHATHPNTAYGITRTSPPFVCHCFLRPTESDDERPTMMKTEFHWYLTGSDYSQCVPFPIEIWH